MRAVGRGSLAQYITCFSLFMVYLAGCGAMTNAPRLYPLPDRGVHVKGDTIYHNDKPFAELRYYFSSELSHSSGEAYLFQARLQHRGLAIYYYKENRLVWIFPVSGLAKDIEKGHYVPRSQNDGYFGWAFDVSISSDGKYVSYKTSGLFSSSSWRYSVEHGQVAKTSRGAVVGTK